MEITILLVLMILMQIEIIGYAGYKIAKKTPRTVTSKATFIDTSVLMDGRIVSAVQSGFVPSQMLIPKSVLAELQLLADGSDNDKRSRARHGLDVASLIQDNRFARISVFDDGIVESGVDDQLLKLAKKYDATICTIDFNLNKVAAAQGIAVLNINELAQQLRMNHLPGEKVSLIIQQKGNDKQQGVGYLSDGTMVVVDQAQADIGKQIEIEFIRSLQTVAGRMLFAKKIDTKKEIKSSRPHNQARNKKPNGRTKSTNLRQQKKPEDSLIDLVNEQE